MTILQALNGYYERLAARGEAVEPGYSSEPVGLVIVLNESGVVEAVREKTDSSGKRGDSLIVPKWFEKQGKGSTPFLFWDNSAYVLGVGNKDPEKTARDHAAFKKMHLELLENETDPGLIALRAFLTNWRPDEFRSPLFEEHMLRWNIGFRFQEPSYSDDAYQFIHQRPAAKKHIDRLYSASLVGNEAFCLVTGSNQPVARLHPKIKGFTKAAAGSIPLVSFNDTAFQSYGKEKGDNAPTSQVASFRYGAALNELMKFASRNRTNIGDAAVVFWAQAPLTGPAGDIAAEAAEVMAAWGFDPGENTDDQSELDQQESVKLRDAFEALANGRPISELQLGILPGTRFFTLGLTPNAGRLSVRFWLEDDFEIFARRLGLHFRDLAIEPTPDRWGYAPSIARLLVKTTALQEKFDNIPNALAGEVARAVLTGARYPRTLLVSVIMRLRAGDDPLSGWHVAAIRAVLARELRLKTQDSSQPDPVNFEKEGLPVSLDRENPNAAYQLGRLFAVMELAQRAALPKVKATIRNRYFSAASSAPATVFPALLRGVQNHLAKLRQENRGGWIERDLESVSDKLAPQFPRSLRLEEQGRFFLGYYHQRKYRPEDKKAAKELAEIETQEDSNDDD